MGVFQPRFIQGNELNSFGFPFSSCSAADQSGLLSLVDTASTMIDEYCGRTDGDGNGSLAYTTYQERLYDQSNGRGIYYLPKKPLASVSQSTMVALSGQDISASGGYYTGFIPNDYTLSDGTLSCIVSISGRYVPGRRDSQNTSTYGYGFSNSYNQDNPFELSQAYGQNPQWQNIDLSNVSYDRNTGELWIGRDWIYSSYSEIVVRYNSGFDPRNYPRQLKQACALVMKNMMPRNGTTGMTSFSSARSGVNAQFTADVIDDNIKRILASFVSSRIY